MLNVDISKDSNKVKVIASGSGAEICSDLTHVFHALIDGMKEQDEKAAEAFKLTFLTGFDNGIVFDCTPEEMTQMRETARKAIEKKSDGFIDFLLDKLNELNKYLEGLDETK